MFYMITMGYFEIIGDLPYYYNFLLLTYLPLTPSTIILFIKLTFTLNYCI